MWYFRPLDWLNFFLADVRGGLGPYVGVFLLTQADWNQATIGAVLTVSGLIGITLHTPIGALIDATHFKRGLIIGGTCALAISAVAIAWAPTLPIVLTADILMAVAGAIFAPTVAAITLGITTREALPARLGRNAAFDRAGNIFIAVLAGVVGWGFSQRAIFYLVRFLQVSQASPFCRSPPIRSTMIAREVLAKTAAWLTIKNPQDGKCCSNVAHCWCSPRRMQCSTSPMLPCCCCSDRN